MELDFADGGLLGEVRCGVAELEGHGGSLGNAECVKIAGGWGASKANMDIVTGPVTGTPNTGSYLRVRDPGARISPSPSHQPSPCRLYGVPQGQTLRDECGKLRATAFLPCGRCSSGLRRTSMEELHVSGCTPEKASVPRSVRSTRFPNFLRGLAMPFTSSNPSVPLREASVVVESFTSQRVCPSAR